MNHDGVGGDELLDEFHIVQKNSDSDGDTECNRIRNKWKSRK